MSHPFWRQQAPFIIIGLLDVFAVGFGMGVPVFAILLGFPVGWWVARRLMEAPPAPDSPRPILRSLVAAAAALMTATFIVLAVVWGPQVPMAFDPSADALGWGIPLILYTSRASIIGWLVLMLLISPVLQFMAVVTGGVLRLAGKASPAAGDSR